LPGDDDRTQQGTSGKNCESGPGGLKTTAKHYAALEAAIIANHVYDTPEILQLPIERGFEKYLNWMQRETS
jgi:periplasmic divalent cation tolerance protein